VPNFRAGELLGLGGRRRGVGAGAAVGRELLAGVGGVGEVVVAQQPVVGSSRPGAAGERWRCSLGEGQRVQPSPGGLVRQ